MALATDDILAIQKLIADYNHAYQRFLQLLEQN